jgi:hypothetical protein
MQPRVGVVGEQHLAGPGIHHQRRIGRRLRRARHGQNCHRQQAEGHAKQLPQPRNIV